MLYVNSIITLNRLQFWDCLMQGGSFQRYPSAHVLAAKSLSSDSPFFNYVFAYDRSCYASAPDIVQFFEGSQFHWWVQPHQTPFIRHLAYLGFRLNVRIQGMQHILRGPPSDLPASPMISVERVHTPHERSLWIQTASQALHMVPQTLDHLCPSACREEVVLYKGLWNHQPVSVCLAFYGPTSVGVYWLATLPSYRGFGVASKILHTILSDAYERRYQMVTLQSSPAAVMVYTRLGFQPSEQYNLYLWDECLAGSQKRACASS